MLNFFKFFSPLLALFLTPTFLLRFKLGPLPTNLFEVLVLLAVILNWRLFWQVSISSFGKNFPKKLLAIFLLALILSLLTNPSNLASWGILKGWFAIPLLLAFLLYRKAKFSPAYAKLALLTIFLGAWGVTIVAFFFQAYGILTYDHRLQAFYASPNELAMFLSPGVLIGGYLFFLALQAQRRTLSVILSMMTLSLLATIYATASYATWLALLATVLFWLRRNKFFKWSTVVFLGLLFFVVSLTLQWSMPKLQVLLFNFSESSAYARWEIWRSALKIIFEHPLFGIGLGNFEATYQAYQAYFPPYREWEVPHPHNLYLNFYLQAGLLGLLAFGALLWRTIRQLSKKLSPTATVLLTYFVLILLNGLFDTPVWKNDLAVQFWSIFMLTWVYLESDSPQSAVNPITEIESALRRRKQ